MFLVCAQTTCYCLVWPATMALLPPLTATITLVVTILTLSRALDSLPSLSRFTALAVSLSLSRLSLSLSRSLVLAVTALTITTLAVTSLLRYNRREQLPRHQLPTPGTKVGHQPIDWFTTLGEKAGGERGRREQGRGMTMRE